MRRTRSNRPAEGARVTTGSVQGIILRVEGRGWCALRFVVGSDGGKRVVTGRCLLCLPLSSDGQLWCIDR